MNRYFKILKKYSLSEKSFNTVLSHSLFVLGKSVEIIAKKKLYNEVDFDLIISGCLLHDIGTFRFVEYPDRDQEKYILHGVIGGKILRSEGLKREALIAERHIGSGISKRDVIKNNLPLPKRDFLPVTLEQKLICYADKFHSKSGKKDSPSSIKKELSRYGKETLERFLELEKMFE